MGGHFFICYSAVDAAQFALDLADRLEAGPPSYPVWLDRRDLRPGEDWDEQVAEALRTCRGLLFVMTEDSVDPTSVCKQEWGRALKDKKPVIPLRLDADAELPFRLGARQYVDFSDDFTTGLARLRQYLAWTGTPDGVLAQLKVRLADAKRDLPRARAERQPLIETEISELQRRIQEQQRLIDSPSAARGGGNRVGDDDIAAAGRGVTVVGGHFFLSYSPVDAAEFALDLADDLQAGPPSYPVWVYERDLRPGEDWDEQTVEALRTCRGVLFLMTEDSVAPESPCKKEWVRALKYKKPVIPLQLNPDAELPYRLEPRESIDLSANRLAGLARLRQYLAWTGSPEGVLAQLTVRLAEAERELARTEAERRPLIEAEIAELQRRIDKQQRLIDDPVAEQEQTAQRIDAGLERERQPERPQPAVPARARFVNPPPLTAPGYFQDRHIETALVVDYLNSLDVRMVTVVGRGGVGKTAMVCRLLKALEAGRLPDDQSGPNGSGDNTGGGKTVPVVDGIVYLSPSGGHPVSFPNVFADLCRLLPEDTATALEQLYKDPHQTPTGLMHALLEAFPTGCSVLLLDNLEDHIDAGTGSVTDLALDEALRAVLTAPAHGIKVVLTTRVAPRELLLTKPGSQRRLGLDEGLASPYAENVLRESDPDGSLGLKTAPPELLATARERTRGYPRALEALAAILAADRDTTLLELLTETARLPGNVIQALVGEAYNRLDPLAQQVMQALAIYPSPVPPVAVDYLLQPYRAAIDAAPVLTRLVNMQFVRRDAGRYYLHQVDRDYALDRLPEPQPDTPEPAEIVGGVTDAVAAADADTQPGPPPFTRRALQQRGADYYAQTRTPRETWKTLDDLAPQLAEYELRYQAGDYDTAAGILLDIDFNYLILWGHYRLTIELHQRLQGRLTDPWTRAATLTNLGNSYLMQDDYPTAIDHYQQALTIFRDIDDSQGEAANLNNLAGIYTAQGDRRAAIDHYQQALTINRDIGDQQGEATNLRGLANSYYMQDDYPTAIDHYQQALTINRDIGDRQGEAGSLVGLGGCYSAQGDYPTAIDHYQQALTINRDIGDRAGEAVALVGLANSYYTQGDYPTAVDHYQQALTINRDIGSRQGEAGSLVGLANSYYTQGDYPTAVDHYQQALTINRDIGSRQGEAGSLVGLANSYYTQGDYPTAVDHYQQALTISRDIGDRAVEAGSLRGLAGIYSTRGDYPTAIDHNQQALTITRDIGSRQGEAGSLRGLAECYSAQGDYPTAIDHNQQALTITRDIGDRQGEAGSLRGLADCSTAQGDHPTAIDHYQQALTITRDIGDRQGEAGSLRGLADCSTAQGDHPTAIDHYQQALTISRDIVDRAGEADTLNALGVVYADQQKWAPSAEHCGAAAKVADAIGYRRIQSEARLTLATTHLLAGDLAATAETAQAAASYGGYAEHRTRVHLVMGIALLRQGTRDAARQALTTAVTAADAQLQQSPRDYQTLYSKAVALSALTLADDQDHTTEATTAFAAARAITTAAGSTARVIQLLDALAVADHGEQLTAARVAATE